MIPLNVSRFFLILFIVYESEAKYYQKECDTNVSSSCSQQISSENYDDCLIHQTNICRQNYKYSSTPPIKALYKDEDASFKVSLVPYAFGDPTFQTSAVNITLETLDPEIKGFFLFLLQVERNVFYNSCRIFDFSQSRVNSTTKNISLFYDCYKTLEGNGNTYTLTIRAVPNNNELTYLYKTPNHSNIETSDLCQWESGVLVNIPSLSSSRILLKFSLAPLDLEVDFYRVYVQDHHNIIAREVNISAPTFTNEMISATFDNIPNGLYELYIIPYKFNTTICAPANPMELKVSGMEEVNLQQWVFIFIIGGALIIVALLGFVMYKVCQNVGDGTNGGTILNLPKPKVFILYSFDCQEHMQVVLKFAEYLKTFCNMEVVLDIWDLKNEPPSFWLGRTVANNHFFLIIISRGIHHKIQRKNKPILEEGGAWPDLFTSALNLVLDKYRNKTNHSSQNNLSEDSCRIIKVFFEYSNPKHVPDCIKKIGNNWVLFGQMNHFLCQLHCQQSKSFPIKIYPKMPGSDIMTSDKGKELDNAVKAMIAFQKQDCMWFERLLGKNENSAEEEQDFVDDSKKIVYLIANDQRKCSSGSTFSAKATFARD